MKKMSESNIPLNLYSIWIDNQEFLVFAHNQSEALKILFKKEIIDEFITDEITIKFIGCDVDFVNNLKQ